MLATRMRQATSGSAVKTVTYTDNAQDTTAGSTASFSSLSIGTASVTRRVIVWIGYRKNGTANVSSCTIAGETGTEHVDSGVTASTDFGSAIYSAAVTTGATGDIDVTMSASCDSIAVIVWAAENIGATPNDTATDQGTDSTSVVSVNTLSGGIVVAGHISTAVSDINWTGVTEDVYVSTGDDYGGGSVSDISAETPRTVQGSQSSSVSHAAAAASW